jgi:hypothetical protein
MANRGLHRVPGACYHGMNIKVGKRYSRGIHFQTNYTWAKGIDAAEARAVIQFGLHLKLYVIACEDYLWS